jgi:uncharacterized protein (TIGR02996 family)
MSEPIEEEMGFIRAVIANPDDDAIRLIYSDWLEEQGRNPEMIRFQASHPKHVYGDHDVVRRCWSRDNFSADLIPPHKPSSLFFCFKEHITCSAKWWLENADWVLNYHPIREATLKFSQIIDNFVRFRMGDWFFLVGDEDRDDPVVISFHEMSDQFREVVQATQYIVIIFENLLIKRYPGINFLLEYDENAP